MMNLFKFALLFSLLSLSVVYGNEHTTINLLFKHTEYLQLTNGAVVNFDKFDIDKMDLETEKEPSPENIKFVKRLIQVGDYIQLKNGNALYLEDILEKDSTNNSKILFHIVRMVEGGSGTGGGG